MTSLSNDVFQSSSIIQTYIATTFPSIHEYLLVFVGCLTILLFIACLILFIRKKDTTIVFTSFPYLVCIYVILLATKKYNDSFLFTPVDTNVRVDTRELPLSFICNMLFLIAKATVYFIFIYIILVACRVITQLHLHVDWTNKFTWIFEKIAVMFSLFSIKTTQVEKDGEVYQVKNKNEKTQFLYDLLDPSNFLNPINPNNGNRSWQLHVCAILITLVTSVVYGYFGIDTIKVDENGNVSSEDDTRIKTQFIEGFTIISIILIVLYFVACITSMVSSLFPKT